MRAIISALFPSSRLGLHQLVWHVSRYTPRRALVKDTRLVPAPALLDVLAVPLVLVDRCTSTDMVRDPVHRYKSHWQALSGMRLWSVPEIQQVLKGLVVPIVII
jgi:hypothetical protein